MMFPNHMAFWNSYLVLAATAILSLTWEAGKFNPRANKSQGFLVEAPWGLSPVSTCFSVYVSDLIPQEQLQVIYKKVTDSDTGFLECIFDTLTKLLLLKSKEVWKATFHLPQQAVSCLWQNILPVLTPFLPILFASLCKIRTQSFFAGKKSQTNTY